jgi:hypothetical protein
MSMSAADIYAECLLPLKEGYLLYCPVLPDCHNAGAYYSAYCSKGISIGDIGIMTPDGDFDFLFNICDSHTGSDVDLLNATNERTSFQPSEHSVGPVGTVGELRLSGIESNPSSFVSVNPPPISSPAMPTGFRWIGCGEVKIRQNYINPNLLYCSCGREEHTSVNLEASMNAIV